MATSSFGKSGAASQAAPVPQQAAPAKDLEVVNPPTAPQVQAPTENTPAVQQPASPAVQPAYSDDADNVDTSDLVFPRINIVQKVGELSNVFPGGAIVLNKSAVLFETELRDANGNVTKKATTPLRIVILGFRPTRYTEKVKGGALGRQVDTPAQVVAAGGTVNYDEAKASEKTGTLKPLFEQTEEALILVKRPETLKGDTVNFPFELPDGSAWAAALWTMKGTAFTHAARHFMTARKIGALRKPKSYADGQWDIVAVLKVFNGNYFYQPIVKLLPEPTPAELKELAALIRG